MSGGPARLTLLGKADCHLCHQMREVVQRALGARAGLLEERLVEEDPLLERRYVFEIPVLLLGEREIARHRVTEAELLERLAAAGWV